MNELTTITGRGTAPTMTSREIADLTGKRHDHVIRDIRNMLVELHGESDLPKFGGVYQGGNGESRPCFHLPKRETLILVSGYSVELRARIIDRWQELEDAQRSPQFVIPQSLPEALRLAADNAERADRAEAALEAAAPKVIGFDRIAEADGSLCVTDTAKALQVRPKDLFGKLQADHWIYRRTGGKGWLGYQSKVQAGLVEHKVETIQRPDGSEAIREQVRITPKGLAKLAEQFAA